MRSRRVVGAFPGVVLGSGGGGSSGALDVYYQTFYPLLVDMPDLAKGYEVISGHSATGRLRAFLTARNRSFSSLSFVGVSRSTFEAVVRGSTGSFRTSETVT